MKEMESFEQEMREWEPRRPSARLTRRLFGRAELLRAVRSANATKGLRRAEFWSWLTPVAACALTLLAAVGSTGHRADSLGAKAGPLFFAGLMLDPSSSNTTQMVQLTDMDENVQWNACPVLLAPAAMTASGRAAATNLNRNF